MTRRQLPTIQSQWRKPPVGVFFILWRMSLCLYKIISEMFNMQISRTNEIPLWAELPAQFIKQATLTLDEREVSWVFAHELCVRIVLLRLTVTSSLQPRQSKHLTVIQLRTPPLIPQNLTTTPDKATVAYEIRQASKQSNFAVTLNLLHVFYVWLIVVSPVKALLV